MKFKLATVLVLGVVGVGAIVYALGGLGAGPTATTEYLTSPATVGTVTEDIAATGTLAATTSTGITFGVEPWTVSDEATGPAPAATYPVSEVKVAVGDTVAKGDVIASADTSDLEDALTRAQNDLKSAEVSMRAADDQLDDASTTAAKRQAKIGRYNALNQLDQAKTAVADLKDQIAAATLVAPVAGLVTEVNIATGSDAPSGAAVVIASDTFDVTTDVVESDLASVKLGQDAIIDIDALDAQVTGKVTAISPVASSDGSVVSFPVTVTIADAPADARAGMSADVTITIASATDVLTVPTSALQGRNGDYTVRTLGADGTPVSTPVQVGLVTDSLAEITGGLDEGTAVVTGTTAELLQVANQTTGGFGGPGGGVVVDAGRPDFGGNGGRGQPRQGTGN